ncbi:MAG: hypothetical protein FWC41_08395 [Firmicutes bacterium]|nr:hypothetical protein [Bacillota bacterium]
MDRRTLDQLKQGVKLIQNPSPSIPCELNDGQYILTVENGRYTVSPLTKQFISCILEN